MVSIIKPFALFSDQALAKDLISDTQLSDEMIEKMKHMAKWVWEELSVTAVPGKEL
jgi:hypothetical protein